MPSNTKTTDNQAEYLFRLGPVLDKIRRDCDGSLSLEQAAQLSHFSKYHFHRIFSAVMGETFSQYCNRIRLEKAASFLLFDTRFSITEIAMKFGFSSSANFSRSFKEQFGVTPMSIRKTKQLSRALSDNSDLLSFDVEKVSQIQHKRSTNDAEYSPAQPVRFETISSFQMCTLRSKNGYDIPGIIDTWCELRKWAEMHNLNPKDNRMFGFACDNPVFTPKEKGRYEACIEISDELAERVAFPFKTQKFGAGKYAVFHFQGYGSELYELQLDIFSDWMAKSQYEPDDVPLIEHYNKPIMPDPDGCSDNNYLDMEIWLKVKPLNKY